MTIDEALELGTRKCAVEAFVNVMGSALNVPERKLHYWLDCYYQLRSVYEEEQRGKSLNSQTEFARAPLMAYAPDESVIPSAATATDAPAYEAPKAAVESGEVSKNAVGSKKRSVKQDAYDRLMKAREQGVTISELSTASNFELSEGDICGMLNAMPMSMKKWRALDNALDSLSIGGGGNTGT